MPGMDTITIRRPDDWHAHFRDGAMMEAVAPFTAKRFARAIVMPNLSPNPILTTEELEAYKKRIEKTLLGKAFTPLMTYYLTEASSPEMIAEGYVSGEAAAVKLYPSNATTNSTQGVTDIKKVYKVFEAMQKAGMPLLLHGETVSKNGVDIDPMDREKVFLDATLPELLKNFPELKVVLEHATTKNAVDFVRNERSSRLGSTITVHHLLITQADIGKSDHPNYLHCMPVVKNETDRKALREAATSGDSYFFLGTDSAPHPVSAKEREKPAMGIFTSPAALELYAQVFDEEGKLEHLETFASINGARFYGLPINEEKVTLEKNPWTIDSLVEVSNGEKIQPFGYHEDPAKRFQIAWRLA